MSIFKEFKQFVNQGSAFDLAIGVIIGGAFGKIVTSFVNDIVMPMVGLLTGHVDFKDKFVVLSGPHFDTIAQARAASVPVLAYGQFINTVVEFLIIAFSIFLVVRQINRLRGPKEAK